MKLLRTLLPAVALLAVPAIGLGPRLAAEEFDSKTLYKKVVKSTVFIVTPMKGGFGMGSGSLIDAKQKLVLTNYHVVDEEDKVYVQFPMFEKGTLITDKRKYMDNIPAGKALVGKVRYRDKGRDLALIELPSIPDGTPALRLAKSSSEQAEDVWNVGSPGDVDQVFSVTQGTVRAVAIEKLRVGDDHQVWTINCRMVTATNPINAGDSGGPLVNKKGELVAVTESSRTRASLVNFFVDVTEVRDLLKQKKITLSEPGEDNPERPIPNKGKLVPKKDPVPSKKEPLKDPATP
jgi:serine protease Do